MSRPRKSSEIADRHVALRRDTAKRLEAIVEAAERAAEGVIDDAEAQARRYLSQARVEADRLAEGRISEVHDLVDSLIGRAASLRQEAEGLQAALEEARDRIEIEPRSAPAQQADGPERQAEPRAPRLRAVSGPDAAPRAEDRWSDAAGARLLATQMAVSGSSREEIEFRLRNGFEIEDAEAILDAILGPED